MQKKNYFRILGATLLLGLMAAAAPSSVQARGEVRLRVEVDDAQTGEQRVRLSIPLNSVEGVLDMIGDQLDLDLDADWMERTSAHGMDLKQLYLAVRDEDLSDFLEVNDEDGEHVRIWKDHDAFHVQVQESHRSDATARIYLPLSVMDALLLGDTAPDYRGALEELRSLAPLTLVEVDDDSERVRVWLE